MKRSLALCASLALLVIAAPAAQWIADQGPRYSGHTLDLTPVGRDYRIR